MFDQFDRPDFGRRAGFGFGPGRGKGRGGRAGRGDLRTAILLLLNEEPMHGYQLMTEIGERTSGHWTPSPGAIYPTLSMLEDEELIDIAKQSGRNLASLTEAGSKLVEDNAEEWAGFFDSYAPHHHHHPHGALMESLGALRQALTFITPNNEAKAQEILERAAADIAKLSQ